MPQYYQNIAHWCDFHNLYEELALKLLPENSIFIEVGVWEGHSICYMAELVKENNKNINLFAVDIFSDQLDDFNGAYKITRNKENKYTSFLKHLQIAQVLNLVTPLALFSEDAAKIFYDNSVDCVFIDAAHDKESITKDLTSWYPKIKNGGYICGHDYTGDDQREAIDQFFAKYNTKVTPYLPNSFIWKK